MPAKQDVHCWSWGPGLNHRRFCSGLPVPAEACCRSRSTPRPPRPFTAAAGCSPSALCNLCWRPKERQLQYYTRPTDAYDARHQRSQITRGKPKRTGVCDLNTIYIMKSDRSAMVKSQRGRFWKAACLRKWPCGPCSAAPVICLYMSCVCFQNIFHPHVHFVDTVSVRKSWRCCLGWRSWLASGPVEKSKWLPSLSSRQRGLYLCFHVSHVRESVSNLLFIFI